MLEQLSGIAADECLMIGNDAKEDMAPTHALGMRTFFLTPFAIGADIPRCWDDEGDYDAMLALVEALPRIG